MTILAIETSCDDTCVAIVEADKRFKVLSNIVSSQVEIHRKWGGVYPSLAKREHQKNLPVVLEKALKLKRGPTSLKSSQFFRGRASINLIAVTVGPGLEPCLWVGVNFTKDLARSLDVPIVPVNHIEAHILVNFQFSILSFQKIFPAIALVVSGGHTQLILMKDIGKYKILGETRDDAAGECFDKVARILGLGYPGGPAIAAAAAKIPNPKSQIPNKFKIQKQPSGESASRPAKFKINLPRPMLNQKNYDFSFSGLKTAVLYNYRKHDIREMAKETQQAIIDVLLKKTVRAAKDYRAKTIILGGGVAANDELRKQFKQKFDNILVPPKKFCTDNAAMVGIAGYFNLNKKTKNWKKIKADANIKL